MELIKLGNTPAKPVKSYKEIEHIVPEFLSFLDERNGRFQGQHDTCYALAHCQVSEEPYALMVIAKDWVRETAGKDMPDDQLFPSRVILNPQVIETKDKVWKEKQVVNPATQKPQTERFEVNNKIRVLEGCMSFPHRSAKRVDRFYEVTVEYQIPQTILGFTRLKTVRETVRGLKAHIFQHECDHMQGINMYYGNRVR